MLDELKEDLRDRYIVNQVSIKDTNLKLVHTDANWLHTSIIEEQYNAKYIGEFALKMADGGWSNLAGKLFYQTVPHPRGSNYMMLYIHPGSGKLFITDGLSSANKVWDAVVDRVSGVVLYSAYRHDYQTYNGLMADGGADYMRCNAGNEHVQFTIVDGEIVIVPKGEPDDRLGITSAEAQVRSETQS